jgi:hypothetical protein
MIAVNVKKYKANIPIIIGHIINGLPKTPKTLPRPPPCAWN